MGLEHSQRIVEGRPVLLRTQQVKCSLHNCALGCAEYLRFSGLCSCRQAAGLEYLSGSCRTQLAGVPPKQDSGRGTVLVIRCSDSDLGS